MTIGAINVRRQGLSVASLCLLLLLAPRICRADSVVTIKERFEGPLNLKDGQLLVAEKPVAWKDVSYLIRDNAPQTISSSRMIRLKNGEVWAAEISGFIGKKLSIDSPLFGSQRIDSAILASIDFRQNLDLNSGRPGTLYRDGAQPIPGEILWIDREKIGINTALGSLTLARENALRFVFSIDNKGAGGAGAGDMALDEIRLRDGSIFKGKTELNGANIELTHAILGKLAFSLNAVSSAQRYSSAAAKVAAFAPENVQFVPLIATKMVPETAAENETGIWGVKLWPGTIAKLPIPERAEKTIFRASLKNVADARSGASVKISAGGKVLFEKTLSGSRSEWLSLELPKTKELEIEVNFAGALRFPAGVVLSEAQMVAE